MDPNWTLLAIAIANAMTAYFAFRTHQSQSKSAATMVELEKNTNSIREQLVATTAKASFAAGAQEARIAGEEKATAVAATVAKEALALAIKNEAKK